MRFNYKLKLIYSSIFIIESKITNCRIKMTSQFASIGKQETTLSAGPKKLLDSAKHSDMPYFLRDENMQKCALPMPKYDDGGFFSTNLGNENHLDFQTFIQHEAKLLEEKE